MSCGCGKKRRRRKPKGCCRKGRITVNPFLNFLRCFRLRHCGWPACKVAIEGARVWCRMTKCQKKRFFQLARKKGRKRGPLIIPTSCCQSRSLAPSKRKRGGTCRPRRSCRPKPKRCPKRKRKRSCPCARAPKRRKCGKRKRRKNPYDTCPRHW